MAIQGTGRWLGYTVASMSVLAGAIASLTYIFATKDDLVKVERAQVEQRADTKLRDFRIKRLEVQVQNVENIAQRTDRNVEKLLIIRRLEPGPKPQVKALPLLPAPDNLRTAE